MSIYHHYGAGKPPIERPDAQTMEELQAQVDGFLRKHPIPEDLEKTKRIDAILLKAKHERLRTQQKERQK
jgi:hypothetical protein